MQYHSPGDIAARATGSGAECEGSAAELELRSASCAIKCWKHANAAVGCEDSTKLDPSGEGT